MAAEETNNRDLLSAGIKVLRRMPPSDVEKDLVRLSCLLDPTLEDELWNRVDLPLKVDQCPETGRDFIVCDYNRDEDSYRSPWSNQYKPPLEDGMAPSGELRQLEEEANMIFDIYRRQYFETGVSSVYMWSLEEPNFAAAFLITKDVTAEPMVGQWNSIHVIEATRVNETKFSYKLISTALVDINIDTAELGKINLSGSISEQREKAGPVTQGDENQSHISNMGPMIEERELALRNAIEGMYFGKTNTVQNGMRVVDAQLHNVQSRMAATMLAAVKK